MGDGKRMRLALVGLGSMGDEHLGSMENIDTVELSAVCDIREDRLSDAADKYGVRGFVSYKEMIDWGEFDGVFIATPHYIHTEIAIYAFDRGFHVLTEKPVGVHVNDVLKMISAWKAGKEKKPDLLFAAMFQQRTLRHWRKIKDMIYSGEIGKLVRATWKWEGGGVLLNQCPHQLDLYQWFFGMPSVVTGFATIGKYHDIEVEDEVTGYFEYENGMVGHFITSTGESPGTNRLEIAGEMGKLVFEDGRLAFYRNRSSMLDYLKESRSSFGKVENWEINVPYEKSEGSGHSTVIENFADAFLNGAELSAPAEEGLNSVSLGNAIMLSSFEGRAVSIPLNGDEYARKLDELILTSRFKKNVVEDDSRGELSSSY